MLSRIKGAIDRSIAEEQARQRALAEQRSTSGSPSAPGQRPRSISRTNSTNSPARRKTKKPSQDTSNGDSVTNPDPAVFEAAFVLDDEDADHVSTPSAPLEKPVQGEAAENEKNDGDGATEQNGDAPGQTNVAPDEKPRNVSPTAPTELPAHVKTKLRKLEKLEATYPELLRSYRIAHGRATSIEPFERALRENTPLTTIKDPPALVEYLNQLNLKGDMIMEEFKRVSAEKDNFKKKFEEAEKEVVVLREEAVALRARQPEEAPAQTNGQMESVLEDKKAEKEANQAPTTSAGRPPVSSILGVFSPRERPMVVDEPRDASEDMFSYDDEIPQLQAEVASKSEEIAKLVSEISILKEELTVAKENSTGLVESLEQATRELSETRDKAAVQDSMQTLLDARNDEIKSLTQKLEQAQAQLLGLEADLEEEKSKAASAMKAHESKLEVASARNTQLDAEMKRIDETRSQLEEKVRGLTDEIDSLKKAKTESEGKLEHLNQQIQSTAKPSSVSTSESPAVSATIPTGGGPKKKNKRKNKKGGAAADAVETDIRETSEQAQPSLEGPENEALRIEVGKLKDEIIQKDTQIERLSKQRKSEEDLKDEIESMHESLINIGHDHVEAKEKIKSLESEKTTLKTRIAELEKEIATFAPNTEASSKLQADFDSMKAEYDELKIKSQSLQSDLGAAQQLAQSRYKDLTDLREVLTKAQPELRNLRQESATLRATKEELASKLNELRSLEKREKDLKTDVARAQRLASDRESEIKLLNDRLTVEKTARVRLEDEKRVAGRDYRRAEAEKIELSAKAEKAGRELESLQLELATLRPKVKQLEDEVAKLRKEKNAVREEVELKTQQYNNAQGLLSSMRDQAAELSIQLKEAQSQSESLEEELAEVQKHLSERTREGETMRRMLADVDERADTKVRDMRSRMEAAVEERDRIEDELSTLARRRARESEELRSKVRELEREVRTLSTEKDELETLEKEWRHRREELEQVEEKSTAEVDDMRAAVTNLRSALDASEQQVRDVEKQRADLRKLLDETWGHYERVSKELKSLKARFNGGGAGAGSSPNVASSGRSSIDSTRSGISGTTAVTVGSTGPDTIYLKTILLQFLEVKDEKVRAQLVPVLGKLLRFDRNDEQKWMAAVQHLSRPGR